MSISGISASAPTFQLQTKAQADATAKGAAPQPAQSSPQQLVGYAAQQAARARYLRTGVDKDAAMGDPDHDAGVKAAQAAASPAPSTTTASSGTGAAGSSVDLVA